MTFPKKRVSQTISYLTLEGVLDALAQMNDEGEWFLRNPHIQIQQREYPKGGFNAIITLDSDEEDLEQQKGK